MGEKLTILGKEYEIKEDGTVVIPKTELDERERVFESKLQENSAELGELRKLRDSSAKDGEQKSLYDFYADPVGSVKKIREEVEKSIVGKIDSIVDAKVTLKTFWRDFYFDNPELKKHKELVNATVKENLESVTKTQSEEEASTLIRTKVLAKLSAFNSTQPKEGEPPVIISGSPISPAEPVKSNSKTLSLSEKLKERRNYKLS